MFMPTVGVTYKFTFVTDFAHWNGTYHLAKMMTYAECLEENIDLTEVFYTPAGKNDTTYAAHIEDLRTSKVLKLIDPESMDSTNPVTYAPLIYLDKVPDSNVKRYYSLAVGLHIGITENPERIDTLLTLLQDHVKAATGITATPQLFEITSSWLTTDEYAAIEAERDQTAKQTISYFTENVKLREEINRLKAINKKYEETYITLSDKVTKPSPPVVPDLPKE